MKHYEIDALSKAELIKEAKKIGVIIKGENPEEVLKNILKKHYKEEEDDYIIPEGIVEKEEVIVKKEYKQMKKAELVEELEKRNIDAKKSLNKKDIVELLENEDNNVLKKEHMELNLYDKELFKRKVLYYMSGFVTLMFILTYTGLLPAGIDRLNPVKSSQEVSLVKNFIDNIKDDKDKACKDTYEIFYSSGEDIIECNDILPEEERDEDEYISSTLTRWIDSDIEVASYGQVKRNLYISSNVDRVEYWEMRLTFYQDDSETISTTTFYIVEIDGEQKITLSYPRGEWFE